MIQLNEQQRVAAYQRGWNDAQRNRDARRDQPIMYHIGFFEAAKGAPHRFESHAAEVTQ